MGRDDHRRGWVPRASQAALIAACLAVGVGLATPARADQVRDAQWQIDHLDLPSAHQISRGEGVTIAVIDSGVDGTHQDLRDNLEPGIDLIEPDSPDGWAPDQHGTSVAGVLAGHGHGPGSRDGVLGVAPAARILPVRIATGDDATATRAGLLADGVAYAVAQGASVISISLAYEETELDRRALEAARRADVVLVAAAGNRPDVEAVAFPAALTQVIAVGATDRDGGLAEFSVTGPELLLTAPGQEIVTTAPGDEYVIASGTSFAAPIVAGVAALIRSADPDLTADQVIHRLISTAADAGPPGPDEQYGHGIVDPVAALTAQLPSPPPPTDEPDDVREAQWHLAAWQLPAAHEVSRGDGVTVALIGGDVDSEHPDLHHNLLPSVDMVAPRRPDAATATVTGTALAGLIAGHGNRLTDHEPGNRGVLGIAPGATILPVAVSGGDLTDREAVELAAEGITRAVAEGAQVICYAAGIASRDLFAEAVAAAQAADVLVVAPATGGPDGELWYPAANPAVLAAVGLDRDGDPDPQLQQPPSGPGSAGSSSPAAGSPGPESGPESQDQASARPAPEPATVLGGYDPAELGPVLAVPGVELISTAPDGGYVEQTPSATAAAAVLAGAAALVRAAYPDLSAAEVSHRLTATAGPAGQVDLVAALTADVAPPTEPPAADGGPPGAPGVPRFGPVVVAVVAVTAVAVLVGVLALRRRGESRAGAPEPPA